MIKIAICDDDINICNQLKKFLMEYAEKFYLNLDVDIFNSGREFFYKLNRKTNDIINYDIIFLDIEIGDSNGIDIGKYIRENLKDEILKIVYVSLHTNYAMKLFKVRPVDFLVKPINKNEFNKTMEILLNLINKQTEYFEFKLGFEKNKVNLKDIIYFETLKESKKIILKTINKEFKFYATIKEIYASLQGYRFILPHNSYIVNYDYIKAFKVTKIELFNGEEIPLSKHRVKEIKELRIKFREEM